MELNIIFENICYFRSFMKNSSHLMRKKNQPSNRPVALTNEIDAGHRSRCCHWTGTGILGNYNGGGDAPCCRSMRPW